MSRWTDYLCKEALRGANGHRGLSGKWMHMSDEEMLVHSAEKCGCAECLNALRYKVVLDREEAAERARLQGLADQVVLPGALDRVLAEFGVATKTAPG